MAKVALVTGGSRGIGAAISTALKDAGYTVAANYAGNDDAARAFTEATGIKTYKWSVADYDACADGISRVEAELGPIAVLVNNAGITRDAMFHKMTPQQWKEVIDTNLTGTYRVIRRAARAMLWFTTPGRGSQRAPHQSQAGDRDRGRDRLGDRGRRARTPAAPVG